MEILSAEQGLLTLFTLPYLKTLAECNHPQSHMRTEYSGAWSTGRGVSMDIDLGHRLLLKGFPQDGRIKLMIFLFV